MKYRRIGTFMIDMAIVQMFAMVGRDIYLGVIAYISDGTGMTLSLNDSIALPALLLLFIGLMLLFIGVFMGYQWICYRLLGTSLSRYLLSVQVVSTDDKSLTKQRYLKREFNKIYLCVATLGLYPLYSGAQYLAFSNPPMHDRTNHTTVIEG
ncbi:RDD family protein [Photobacterium kishitanii]|uniref:RDD family protein n=1 Tax=Photobacterium kishitanii TaxID=318456 RepID=UPI001F328D2C|nr:RDD family protein [Photobacterium kishitanii]